MIFKTNLHTQNLGLTIYGRARWQEAEATRKDFNVVLTSSGQEIICLRALQGHSGRNPIDPSLQDNVLIPNDFFEYIYHIGCAINLHSITNSGLMSGGQNFSRKQNRLYSFFTAVNPMHKNHQDPIGPNHVLHLTCKKWKVHQDTVYWVDIQLAQRKGLKFHQTRSNAVILYDTLPPYCILKAIVMKSEETKYQKVYGSQKEPQKEPKKKPKEKYNQPPPLTKKNRVFLMKRPNTILHCTTFVRPLSPVFELHIQMGHLCPSSPFNLPKCHTIIIFRVCVKASPAESHRVLGI